MTYLQFTSLPVFLSITMSRTQGGGVMGRRSWTLVSYAFCLDPTEACWTHLVTKPAHSGPLRLLYDDESVGLGQPPKFPRRQHHQHHLRVYPAILVFFGVGLQVGGLLGELVGGERGGAILGLRRRLLRRLRQGALLRRTGDGHREALLLGIVCRRRHGRQLLHRVRAVWRLLVTV